jgi:NADH-quinone oxidoreductase subunit L
MSGGFALFFIGWAFISLTSYVSIFFHNTDQKANRAARKTATVAAIGDLALLGAMAIVLNVYGTLDFSGVFGSLAATPMPLTAVALLTLAILAKAAQFPFHEWLPDALEGPAPFAAFLSSGTAVKAGLFAAIILFPIFYASGALPVLFFLGLVTAVIGTLNALTEKRVKRVLAYSTVQGLGLALMAVGSGSLAAAVYFLFAQGFYMSLLFLCAGISAKATGKENLDEMGGLAQNKTVYLAAAVGVLSLAGLVPFSGFFANMGMASALGGDLAAYAIISLISLTTSVYCTRWLVLQAKKTGKSGASLNYRTVPRSMMAGAALLAAGALLAGAGFFILPGYVGAGAQGATQSSLQITTYGAAFETGAVAVGVGIGYYVYARRKRPSARAAAANPDRSGFLTMIANAAFSYAAAFVMLLGDGFNYFDAEANGMFDGLGHFVMKFANSAKRLASREISAYVVVFAVGMLLLLIALAII